VITGLVMSTLVPPDSPQESGEAELIVVEVDMGIVVLTLDDGQRILVDRCELLAVIREVG